jgi:hypothetical protein
MGKASRRRRRVNQTTTKAVIRPASTHSHSFMMAGALVVIVLFTVLGIAQVQSAQQRHKFQAQAWDLLPEPELLPLGTPPEVVPMRAIPLPWNWQQQIQEPFSSSSLLHIASERMRMLVQTNPVATVREDLDQLIRDGVVYTNFSVMNGNGMAAAFAHMPISMLYDSGLMPGESRTHVPVISFDLETILSINSPDEVRAAMLVLYHEDTHRYQWERYGDEERRLMEPSLVNADGSREKLSPKACEQHWESEFQAYLNECETFMNWGMQASLSPSVVMLCRRVGSQEAFLQAMFFLMKEGYAHSTGECLPVWAKKAGHPRPWAFEP